MVESNTAEERLARIDALETALAAADAVRNVLSHATCPPWVR
jgi:hypothetical protein